MADRFYIDKRSARTKTGQVGQHIQFWDQYPSYYRLKVFEKMFLQDSCINKAITTLADSVVGSIASISHPDSEIEEFLNTMLLTMEDSLGYSWKSILSDFFKTKMWAGFAVAEIIYDVVEGSLVVTNIVNYNPRSIVIRPNSKGKLVDGEPTSDGLKSGIFQTGITGKGEVKLPLWKVLYQAHESYYGDYMGRSCLAPAYKWYRLKEHTVDLLMSTLSRSSNPLSYIVMKSYEIDEGTIDPATGESRKMTSIEYLDRQISEIDETGRNFLLIPRILPEDKVDIGTLTTGNNFASSFIDTLNYLDQQIVHSLKIPVLLVNSKATAAGEEVIERTMDNYQRAVQHERNKLLSTFCKQVLFPVQQWNFNRESARILPSFAINFGERSEDRVSTMQVVRGLASIGSLNPRNQEDANLIRQILSLPTRELTEDDIEFINVVNKFKDPGRPSGLSSPLNEPRTSEDS